MKIIICTIKSWNIKMAEQLKALSQDDITIMTQRSELTLDNVEKINPDYIFFPHWSYIIPKEIYENYNCVVFHMTDLPFGRGGSPLQNLIVRGIKKTKISAIKVVGDIDAGPVYFKEDLELYGSATEIFYRTSKIIFEKMIPDMIKNKPQARPQQGEVVKFARRTPDMSEITKDMSLEQIYDHIRMLDAEGYPHAFIKMGKYRLEFTRAGLGYNEISCNVVIREEDENE